MQYVEFLQGQKDGFVYPAFFSPGLFWHRKFLCQALIFTNTWVTHSNSDSHAVHFQHRRITRKHKASLPSDCEDYEEPWRNIVDKWSNPAQQVFWACKSVNTRTCWHLKYWSGDAVPFPLYLPPLMLTLALSHLQEISLQCAVLCIWEEGLCARC